METERIWIYQADRLMTAEETQEVLTKLQSFTSQWKAHGKKLAADVEVLYGLFIVLKIDESVAPPTGCSIDKSVHLLKELETQLNIDFFDRMKVAYQTENGEIRVANRDEFESLLRRGQVHEETFVFNNLVNRADELPHQWKIPFRESWHAKVFS